MGELVSDPANLTTETIRERFADAYGNYQNGLEDFDRWLARYRESVIDEVEDHLVRRDQFTERTLDVIDELREKK